MINKYKYYLDNKEFTPVNLGDFSFNISLETEAGAYHYVKQLEGKISIENPFYDYILKGSETQNFYIEIFEYCDEGDFKIFDLYFTHYNCEFSPDERRVMISTKQNNLYNCLTANYDKEFNFLEVANVVNTIYEQSAQFEYYIKLNDNSDVPFFGSFIRVQPSNNTPFALFPGAYWFVYAREIKTVYCQGGQPQPPDGSGWEILNNNCGPRNLVTYYRKPPIFDGPPLLTLANFDSTVCATPCTPPPPPVTGLNEDWVLMGTFVYGPATRSFFVDNNAIKGDTINYNNGRLLTDVINYGLNKDCAALDLQSQFLFNEINPVTGSNPSETQGLQIHAISDIKTPNASEPATLENITLKSILNDYISSKLNCFWRIDEGTQRLIIEHYKDLNYTGTTDLTAINGGKWLKLKNKYSFDSSNTPRAEAFPSLDFSIDYTGVNIEYINDVGEGVKTYNTDKFYAEIERITSEPENYPNEGAVMITPESLAPIGDPEGARSELGVITGDYGPNMPQAMANLQDKFWKYWRPFENGKLNFNAEAFTKNQPNKKAETVTIPINCFFLFDPYTNFITNNFNNGYLQSATYNPKTGFIEIELKYF